MTSKITNRLTDEEIERVVNAVLEKVNPRDVILSEAVLGDDLGGETVTRSFKLYKNVLDKFVDFCNNSKYTQYELLSRFILEGIEKYS